METMNATATEARQHFNRCVNWVEAGARVQIVRHDRVAAVLMSATDAAKLQRLESEHQRVWKKRPRNTVRKSGRRSISGSGIRRSAR